MQRHNRRRSWLVAVALIIGTVVAPKAAFASVEIRLLIPTAAGGSYNTTARLLAPIIAENLGPDMLVVPMNVVGAGGRKAATELARSDPDGLTIMLGNYPAIATDAITGGSAPYDVRAFTPLALIRDEPMVVVASADGPIDSVETALALDRPLKVVAVAPGSSVSLVSEIFWQRLGAETLEISGFPNNGAVIASILRGDGDVTATQLPSFLRRNADAGLVALATLAPEARDGFGPNGSALGHPELDRLRQQQVFIAPPGLPEDVRDRLSNAIITAVGDPRTDDYEASTGSPFKARPAAEAATAIGELIDTYQSLLSDVRR